ncbi:MULTISPECIES: hypothetical protein [unclassified Oceanispirochaeta]|uniref:hypothetical protein n=1 Tax=unclassified Oceanispirochaeta TaxID=2635722 RepID=UPI000E08D19B|nr:MULTISPECIES: hypothetical protein [unclassified Oceanispirochaeta]MBF9017788.1 hypothetical protein [Oceanispirochaeta sp. M2]NPD74352.1 hypothetical protein [Oceanispirochaeta sp. M1]RDG29831.1 hypothetical protein DV872_19815 [Oceanispirochaeta sp. M1]
MKKIIITITGLLLLLSSCGNMADLSDQGTVSVKLTESGSSRYIAGEGETVDEAILGFVEQDVMYNFEFIEEITDFEGDHLFTGIPVGDYSFLAMLLSDGDIISMAIQAVTIEAGKNDLIIDMGPGFHFLINDLDFDMSDLEDDYSLSLSGNEITIGIPAEELERAQMEIDIKTNASAAEVLNYDGTAGPFTWSYAPPADELSFSTGELRFDPAAVQEIQLNLTSPDASVNSYLIVFKGL